MVKKITMTNREVKKKGSSDKCVMVKKAIIAFI